MIYPAIRKAGGDVVHRYKGNPLIAIEDLLLQCSYIWNAGVLRFQGKYLPLLTMTRMFRPLVGDEWFLFK